MDHIQPIVTVCSAVFGSLGVFGALYYVHQKSDERFQKSDDRWAALKTESDERWAKLLESFCDFKNVTVDRFNKIENKNQ